MKIPAIALVPCVTKLISENLKSGNNSGTVAQETSCRREAAAICPRQLWPWPLTFDLESGVLVTTCDVGYLCANFSLPRPVCSRLRPDVRDRQTGRQTDRRQTEHTHFVLTAIFPGEPGLAGCPLIPLILLLHLFLTAHPFGTGINFSCHS